MTSALLLLAALNAAPSAEAAIHVAPGPDAFPNARSIVWIPAIRYPVGPVEVGVRAPVFSVRRDCRVENCSTSGLGNPALEVAWYFEIGRTGDAPPTRPSGTAVRPDPDAPPPPPPSPGWITRVAGRVHAPLSDPELDEGRSARTAGQLAPELWPDVTPDALPVVVEAGTSRRLSSWLAVEGEAMLAGLVPLDGDGGVVAAVRADGHVLVAGQGPVALSVFGRGRMSVDALDDASAMFSPGAGARFRVGSGPVPGFSIEVAARFVAWHADDDLPDDFVPGFDAAIVVGLP